MNTTEKGDKFEEKILNHFKREISAGRFLARPDWCRIFWKKGYYSDRRKANIKFDISVEIGPPDAAGYSILYLIECKDYEKRLVPADDVEEFHAKIQQVAGVNVKGVMVSSKAFQSGALEYARSTGIGLLRYFDEANSKWILNRAPSAAKNYAPQHEIHNELTIPDYEIRHFNFGGYAAGKYTNSLGGLFHQLALATGQDFSVLGEDEKQPETIYSQVPYLHKNEIERLATTVLAEVNYLDSAVSLDNVCSWQAKVANLTVHTGVTPSINESRNEILGRISFSPLEIAIYAYAGENEARERFTLAHELGHHFLGHSKHLRAEYCQEGDFQSDEPSLVPEDIRRLEWQANHFASCLLLPRAPLLKDFLVLAEKHSLVDRGFGLLYVDEQGCNQKIYLWITDFLKQKYRVSRAALNARLRDLGLLNDVRATKPGPARIF